MKENIIYFVADQLRADALHCLGNQASHTPNLDSLANQSVTFANAFCQNPVCVPSRCSFLTGLYPHTLGHRTMHFLQNESEPSILKTMKENGYEVAWFGRNDLIPSDRDKSAYCDEYFGMEDVFKMQKSASNATINKPAVDTTVDGYYSFYLGQAKGGSMANMDEIFVGKAIDYLERKQKQNNDKPFFLYVTLGLPHPPYVSSKPFYGSTDRNNLPARRPDLTKCQGKPSMLKGIHDKQNLMNWDEEKWNELRGTYLDMVSQFDDLFGKIKSKLVETGLDASTNIFVFSDHGDYTGDYGIAEKVQNCFDDPVCNVPLIIRPSQAHNVKPRITSALAELTDLTATVCDICDIKLNYTQFGQSLVHVLDGDDSHRQEVHCEGGRIHGETQCMELGHGKESQYWPRLDTQASEGPEHTKALMLRNLDYKYVKRLYEDDELYDLRKDPMESHNCIYEKEYADIVSDFQLKALDFLLSTTDYVPNRKDKR